MKTTRLKRITIALMSMMLVSLTSVAQNDITASAEYIYNSAEKSYNLGNFDDARAQLLPVVNAMTGIYKTGAYYILALCELKQGHEAKARQYVELLLKNDPYYTPKIDDPQRFVDIINESKGRSSGIITASRQEESVEEAPVPVTVITEDMIQHSGASTLQEVLCLYVPGMSYVEGMEANIAMHGVYDLLQNKILFLQDGHKLNGSSTNSEAPDYRNSLDKIKQIEVLRGAVSSLYGNVALTAVVNIITKKGAELKGGNVSGTIGTQNTLGGSFLIGGGYQLSDIIGWGSIAKTDGTPHTLDGACGKTTLYSGSYNRRPSYDIGLKARWGDLVMTLQSQRSKKTPYVNMLQVSSSQHWDSTKPVGLIPDNDIYDYANNFSIDNYSDVNGNAPGLTRTSHHIFLDFSHSWGKVDFLATAYVSLESTYLYNVIGDSIDNTLSSLIVRALLIPTRSSTTGEGNTVNVTPQARTRGVFSILEWQNVTYGGMAQMLTNYNLLGKGSFMLGLQFEHLTLSCGSSAYGGNYSSSGMTTFDNVFRDGSETVLSAYAQVKHKLSSQFIVNAGLRYDHGVHYDDNKYNSFSPRLSLIYKPNDNFSLRLSNNYSLVDAPFVYRICKIGYSSGDDKMKQETMKSFQVVLCYHPSAFTAEISGFYNIFDDLIECDISKVTTSENNGIFQNIGGIRQVAVDGTFKYSCTRFFVNANATWQKILSTTGANIYEGNRYGIPPFMGTVVAAWAPYVGKGKGFFGTGKLWLNFNATARSKTYYRTADVLKSAFYSTMHCQVNEVSPNVIMGMGVTYDCKNLALSVALKNITDNQYTVGSALYDGVPYSGRQVLGKVTVKF